MGVAHVHAAVPWGVGRGQGPHLQGPRAGFPDVERGRKVSEEKFSDKFRNHSPPSVHQAFTKASTTFRKPSATFPEASRNRKFSGSFRKFPEVAEGVPKVSEAFLPLSAPGNLALGPCKGVTAADPPRFGRRAPSGFGMKALWLGNPIPAAGLVSVCTPNLPLMANNTPAIHCIQEDKKR